MLSKVNQEQGRIGQQKKTVRLAVANLLLVN